MAPRAPAWFVKRTPLQKVGIISGFAFLVLSIIAAIVVPVVLVTGTCKDETANNYKKFGACTYREFEDVYVSYDDGDYNFFTDKKGTVPLLYFRSKTHYRIRRLNNETSQPFFISDRGFKQKSSSSIIIKGDGDVNNGITGDQSMTIFIDKPESTYTKIWYFSTSGTVVDSQFNVNPVMGCTDETAFNYDAAAHQDDPQNPCIAKVYGCTNSIASNYNANANIDDDDTCEGCMDPRAENYLANSKGDPTSNCILKGCTDGAADNYMDDATLNEGCEYYQCLDGDADNTYVVQSGDTKNYVHYSPKCTFKTTQARLNSKMKYVPYEAMIYQKGTPEDMVEVDSIISNFTYTTKYFYMRFPVSIVSNVMDPYIQLSYWKLQSTQQNQYIDNHFKWTFRIGNIAGISYGSRYCIPLVRLMTTTTDNALASNNYFIDKLPIDEFNSVLATDYSTENNIPIKNPNTKNCFLDFEQVRVYILYDGDGNYILLIFVKDVFYDFDLTLLKTKTSGEFNQDIFITFQNNTFSVTQQKNGGQFINAPRNNITDYVPYMQNVDGIGNHEFKVESFTRASNQTVDLSPFMDSAHVMYIGGSESLEIEDFHCQTFVPGCTDSTKSGYNSRANVDDGSCEDIKVGCMNTAATNYDPDANVDDQDSCYFEGCTDQNAFNYDPMADTEDNSCQFYACLDSNATNTETDTSKTYVHYSPMCTYDTTLVRLNSNFQSYDNTRTVLETLGAPQMVYNEPVQFPYTNYYDLNFIKLSYWRLKSVHQNQYVNNHFKWTFRIGNIKDSSSVTCIPLARLMTTTTDDALINAGIHVERIPLNDFNNIIETNNPNYTDVFMNYNQIRVNILYDGIDRFILLLFVNQTFYEYDLTLMRYKNTDEFDNIVIITYENNKFSVQQQSGDDASSRIDAPRYAFTQNMISNLDAFGNHEFFDADYTRGSDDAAATVDLSSFTGSTHVMYVGGSSDLELTDFHLQAFIGGCMDSTMFNYNSLANVDDGSCVMEVVGCMDPNASNYNAGANNDTGGLCEYIGCTDPIAENYNAFMTTDDGSCTYIDGCTDTNATNYDATATRDDGSCTYIDGCTDSNASNYNPNATRDDGSCQYPPGCNDPTAINYVDTDTNDLNCIYPLTQRSISGLDHSGEIAVNFEDIMDPITTEYEFTYNDQLLSNFVPSNSNELTYVFLKMPNASDNFQIKFNSGGLYTSSNFIVFKCGTETEYLNGTEHEYSHNDGNGLVGNTRELHKCDILDSTGTSQLEDNGPTNEKASCIFRGGTAPTTYGEWFDVHPHVNNYYIGNSTNHTQYSNNYNVYDNYMSNTEPKYLQIFVFIATNFGIDYSISIRKKPTS